MTDGTLQKAYKELMKINGGVLVAYIPSPSSLSKGEDGSIKICTQNRFALDRVREAIVSNGNGFVPYFDGDKYAELYPQIQEKIFEEDRKPIMTSKKGSEHSLPYVRGTPFILHDGIREITGELEEILKNIYTGSKPEEPILLIGKNGVGKTALMSYLGWKGADLGLNVSYADVDDWADFNKKNKGEKNSQSLINMSTSELVFVDSLHKIFYGESYRTKCGEDVYKLLNNNLKNNNLKNFRRLLFLSFTESKQQSLDEFLDRLSKKNSDLSSRIEGIKMININALDGDRLYFLKKWMPYRGVKSMYVNEIAKKVYDNLEEDSSFRRIIRRINQENEDVMRNNRVVTNQGILFKERSIKPILDILSTGEGIDIKKIVGFDDSDGEINQCRGFVALAGRKMGLTDKEIADEIGGRKPKEIEKLAEYVLKTLSEENIDLVMKGLERMLNV